MYKKRGFYIWKERPLSDRKTRRYGNDHLKAAAKIEGYATAATAPTKERKTEVREMLKGDDGEQVMIRLSGVARSWLTANKVMTTEAEPAGAPPQDPPKQPQSPPKDDN